MMEGFGPLSPSALFSGSGNSFVDTCCFKQIYFICVCCKMHDISPHDLEGHSGTARSSVVVLIDATLY